MRNEAKLKIVFDVDRREFVATHPNTNVTGCGNTPGDAIRNWQYWWNAPY